MDNKKYKIGLDIGSNSVGWCVTDEDFKIVEKDNKKLWGVLLFEEQQSNQARRANRGARRRIERKRKRILYLQEIFKNEIDKIDPTFFGRLNESFKQKEDKKYKDKYTLFIDKTFNDKTFFKKYPTIYHLQKELMESDSKKDIRLIYLAIANCIKDRGNFLSSKKPENYKVEFSKDETKEKLMSALKELSFYMSDEEKIPYDFDSGTFLSDNFDEILKNNFAKTNNDKKIEYNNIFVDEIKNARTFKNSIFEFAKLVLCGNKITLDKYFKDYIDDKKLEYKVSEEQEIQLNKILEKCKDPDNLIKAINNLESIYQSLQLLNIFKGNVKTLPDALVARFDNYKKDLKNIKEQVKSKFGKDIYYEIFINPKLQKDKNSNGNENNHNYVHYTSSYRNYDVKNKTINKCKLNTSKCSRDEFVDYLKKVLKLEKRTDDNAELYDLVTKEDFLLKPKTHENSIFPYQLKYNVVKTIIEKQKKHYKFFDDVDEDGYKNEDKILSILSFRIPYYYGPLTIDKEKSKWAWISKLEGKENENIRPWNYSDIVDDNKTQETFITKMQNRCTYLKNEYTLPKDSIVFQKYLVYQFLNYVRINGKFFFDADQKEMIISNLFINERKVTNKSFKEYVNTNILKIKATDESDISFKNGAIDDNIPSLSSLYDFIKVYGSYDAVEKNLKTIEEVIRDIAILQDKDILALRLKNKYGFNDNQIKKIKGFNYKNFSPLSYKLLNEITPCDKNGVVIEKTILTLLKECKSSDDQGLCLNRLLELNSNSPSYQYDFKCVITKENGNENCNNIDNFIDDLYVPVSSKRAIKQSCRIIDEIGKILDLNKNYENVSFVVEVTRKKQKNESGKKSKAKETRYKEMSTILNKAFEKDENEQGVIDNFNELKDRDEGIVRSEKYYYYFMQLGKDMYTGETIEYDDLDNYDIDHIIPQSLVKNDSIDNKVLTNKNYNEGVKKNIYPFFNKLDLFRNNGGPTKAKQFWKKLLDNKLISKIKYESLCRTSELCDSELEDFENRQKTTTDQSVIGFINVLKDFYKVEDKNVIYSKASNVSYFRNKFEIYKSRIINNYHHAHDAYLNIIIGSILDNEYKKTFAKYKSINNGESFQQYLEKNKYSVNPEKIIERFFNVDENKELLLSLKNSIFLTKNIFTKQRTYLKGNNIFEKVSLLPKGNFNIPIKNGLACEKYGHYAAYNFAKYCLLRNVNNNGKVNFVLEAIPSLYLDNSEAYLKELYGLDFDNYSIYLDNLKVNTKFKIGEKEFVITGKTNDQYVILNSVERSFAKNNDLCASQKLNKTIHKLEKVYNYANQLTTGDKLKLLNCEKYMNEEDTNLQFLNDLFKRNYYISSDFIKNPYFDKKDESIKNKSKSLCINKTEVDELYNFLINLYLNKKCYSSYTVSNNIVRKLFDSKKYETLNILFKIKVIMELFNLFSTNERKTIDLTILGIGKKKSGTLTQGKKIILGKNERVKVIFESVTGFYKKVITLK
jgi:CRISPR-associated endonuclease Csn1